MAVLQGDTQEDLGTVPRCRECGSERVVKASWTCWNSETGFWELEVVLDRPHCLACGKDTTLAWSGQDGGPKRRIRELNDQFRRHGVGNGSVLVTQGVQGQGDVFAIEAVRAVRLFDTFSQDNDPWGEHDFGSVEIDGQKVFFKIDYYDPTLTQGSENPANEGCTHRVLTIMLASEY